MNESVNFINLAQQPSRLYKVLQPCCSLQSLLQKIQRKSKKIIANEFLIVYDDNRVPLQQHNVNFIPPQKELGLYQWRNESLSPIVKVHHITFQSIKDGQKFYKGAILFTDHIVETFQQLADLPLPGLLYLLKEVLLGFTEIFQYFGKVVIKPELCGIDVVGRCKVWVNQDFSKNQVQKDLHQQFYAYSQSQIVLKAKQLIRNIGSLSNQQIYRFFMNFDQFIKSETQKRTLKPHQAIRFIEKFSLNNNIAVSNFISPFFFQMKINKRNSEQQQSNLSRNPLKQKCQKTNHVPKFLMKNNRKQSAAQSFCKQNQEIVGAEQTNKKYNYVPFSKTPMKQSTDHRLVEQLALNRQLCQNKANKTLRDIEDPNKSELNRRKTLLPQQLLNKRQCQFHGSLQNGRVVTNIRQVASAQNIFKVRTLNNRDYHQERCNQNKGQDLITDRITQLKFQNDIVARPNIIKSINYSNATRKAFTPLHMLHQNNSAVSSSRNQSKLRKRKISDLSDCKIQDSIGCHSDFSNLKESYKNHQHNTFNRKTSGMNNYSKFVEINQFNDGKEINIDGVQFIDETDLVCRQPLKGKKQVNFSQNRSKKTNLISNQYNITLNSQDAEKRCDSQHNINDSQAKKTKQSMTSTAQYTVNSRIANTNKKNVFNSNQQGSLNWINNSNRSIQNHIEDFQVRMADSYLVSRMQDRQDCSKTGTTSTLPSKIGQLSNTRSFKQLYPSKHSPAQSFASIQNQEQNYNFPLVRGKTDNTFQKFLVYNNPNISLQKEISFQPKLQKKTEQDSVQNFLPLSFRQIKNIATVQSGFIRMNVNEFNQANYNQICAIQSSQNNIFQQIVRPNSWQMNKKIQNFISNKGEKQVVQSICEGNDFGRKEIDMKESDLKILGKMGRQIDSTIFSDED